MSIADEIQDAIDVRVREGVEWGKITVVLAPYTLAEVQSLDPGAISGGMLYGRLFMVDPHIPPGEFVVSSPDPATGQKVFEAWLRMKVAEKHNLTDDQVKQLAWSKFKQMTEEIVANMTVAEADEINEWLRKAR